MPSSLNGIGVTFNDGTQLQSANEAGGDYDVSRFTSPATWTKPAGLKAVKVTIVGGGGGGGGRKVSPPARSTAPAGAGGGVSITYLPAASIPGPVSVTVGAAGAGGVAQPGPAPSSNAPVGGTGGTSSFGAFASATGGGGGSITTPQSKAAGSGTGGTILNARGSTNDQVIGREISGLFEAFGGGNNPLFLYEYGRTRESTPTNIQSIGNGESATANSGCGGGGARAGGPTGATGRAGGAGGAGLVIVEEFY